MKKTKIIVIISVIILVFIGCEKSVTNTDFEANEGTELSIDPYENKMIEIEKLEVISKNRGLK